MKRILSDMGLLGQMVSQRAFKFEPPFGPQSELERVPPPTLLFFLSGKSTEFYLEQFIASMPL